MWLSEGRERANVALFESEETHFSMLPRGKPRDGGT